MDFTVLTDTGIKSLLATLSKQDVVNLLEKLLTALATYSTQNEHTYQPHRAAVSRPDGQVTLFMAATTPIGVATKIVGCPPPSSGSAANDALSKTLQSVLTLCDGDGRAYGVINAAEFTAFRTSLGSMILYPYRKNTSNIVVFGAGKQAFWHIRLALLLRGAEIRKVTVVNRSPKRSMQLLEKLEQDARLSWQSDVRFEVFDPAQNDLEALVVDSDVIFCTTPAREPLFPASYLLSEKASDKARYVTAIGSYTVDMAELDPALFRSVVDSKDGYHPNGNAGGAIFVDSRAGCFTEAGEVVQATLARDSVIEVGELPDLQKSSDTEALSTWLSTGFVAYKSVGMGVMDITIGDELVSLAKSKSMGFRIDNF